MDRRLCRSAANGKAARLYLVGGLYVQKYKGGIRMQYFNEVITADGLTISVDMITADYYIGNVSTRSDFELFLRSLPFKYNVDTEFWECHKIGRYRGNYTVKLSDRNSFYIGVALNGLKTEWGKCRIEFNPNKVASHQILLYILGWLNSHTRPMHRSIRRFDLAIDVPISRLDVRLLKDRRIYSERKYGEEWTEYLGAKSSSVGRCKLYNKTIESKLNYPLTRLELTLNPEISYDNQPWPSVYYISNQQVQLHELVRLNDTQRFILNALLSGFGNLTDLGRKQRDTIKPYMDNCVKWITVSTSDYTTILRQLDLYLKKPSSLLDSSNIISDARISPLPF